MGRDSSSRFGRAGQSASDSPRDVPFSKPKIGPFLECIRQILEDDRLVPRKQRHTAKRIFERIPQEGYTGGYTQVKEAVREIKQKGQEVFVPLIHRPGEAQVDFGFALVNVNGQLRKLPFFVMTLPYSDAIFVQVYERMSTEIYSRRTPSSIRVLRWCTRSDHV